jgi:uncharacterized protein YqeY
MTSKATITEDMKTAMRAQDKPRLLVIRSMLAAIKQIEVDERRELSDEDVLAVIIKMVKQRKESIRQYTDGNRLDLVDVEQAEIEIIQDYLPEALSSADVEAIIKDAIAQTGAESMKDMGKVMGIVKPKVQGRADMGVLSQTIKALLSQE